jgi:hypothetical protein
LAKKRKLDLMEAENAKITSDAKAKLGVMSEYGVEETRCASNCFNGLLVCIHERDFLSFCIFFPFTLHYTLQKQAFVLALFCRRQGICQTILVV